MKKVSMWVSAIADILGVAGFIGCMIIAFGNSGHLDKGLELHSFAVGVLGAIVTLLIGWNIYSVIDCRQLSEKIDDSSNKIDDGIKRIDEATEESHQISLYYNGMTYATLCAAQYNVMRGYKDFGLLVCNGIHGLVSLSRSRYGIDDIQDAYEIVKAILESNEKWTLDESYSLSAISLIGKISDEYSRIDKDCLIKLVLNKTNKN